jgi:hypothetical protein
MTRNHEETDLISADSHIATAKMLIAGQQLRVDSSIKHGKAFDQSTRLLLEMNISLELMHKHRTLILGSLAEQVKTVGKLQLPPSNP